MGVVFGLLAAALYGAADFLGGIASKRSSVFAVVVVSQASGLLLLLAAAPFFHGRYTGSAMLFGAAAGVCAGAGITLLYRALSIGKMGVVSPVTAVLAAIVPVFVGVFARGEHLGVWRGTGIALALVAVVLISMSPGQPGAERSMHGLGEAIASGIALSGFYVFLAYAGKSAGIYPLLSARASSSAVVFLAAVIGRGKVKPERADLATVASAAAIDASANVLYLLAADSGYLSIAAVLTSLYPASTVVLARVVLHERLAAVQKVGVGLALAGVALIAS